MAAASAAASCLFLRRFCLRRAEADGVAVEDACDVSGVDIILFSMKQGNIFNIKEKEKLESTCILFAHENDLYNVNSFSYDSKVKRQ